MIPLHNFLLYVVLYTIAVAVPGPGIVAIVARALGGGFKSTVPAVMGNALGDLALMTLSALGLAVVARAMGGLFQGVKLAGAAYLIYLGYKYWTQPVAEMSVAPSRPRDGFVSQLLLTLGNPKAIVMFLAILPSAVDLNRLTAIGYGELCAATLVVIPAVEFAYAALAAQVRVFLSSVTARRRLNKGAGAVMIGAGVGVAVS
jgi:threonine/homoserine/homoserine lactone efflux protein